MTRPHLAPPPRYQEEIAQVDAELGSMERQISQQRGYGGMYGGGGSAASTEDLDKLKKQRSTLQVCALTSPTLHTLSSTLDNPHLWRLVLIDCAD